MSVVLDEVERDVYEDNTEVLLVMSGLGHIHSYGMIFIRRNRIGETNIF